MLNSWTQPLTSVRLPDAPDALDIQVPASRACGHLITGDELIAAHRADGISLGHMNVRPLCPRMTNRAAFSLEYGTT
jgi:hypothetical protein